ncbi:hypothetical protein BY458DRAFT_532460 [Sporodiniella umbellata]|nr:hypothetical protein BY458DRAFT_532460 [Sporodiniella umbellata]
MQKNILCVFIFAICYVRNTLAVPKFTSVNDLDAFGHKCPLPTYHAYQCPELCVRDISSCPNPPKCPPENQYCVDGTCRTSCSDTLISACSCPGAPALVGKIYSCGPQAQVDIPNFIAGNKSQQSIAACTSAVKLPQVFAWSENPLSVMWKECPTPDNGSLTFTENIFIALYTFYGTCFLTLILWTLYKGLREKSILKAKSENGQTECYMSDQKNTEDSDSEVQQEEKEISITAYKTCFVGNLMKIIFIFETVGQLAYMIVVTQDYYTNFQAFRGKSEVAKSVFMGMWYILFIWFSTLTVFGPRVPNYFRLKCIYSEGQYVQVEKKEPALILLEKQSNSVLDRIRDIEMLLRRWLGTDVIVSCLDIEYTSSGTKYFSYQCTRYVYRPELDLFSPHKISLGTTHSDLIQSNKGLTSQEAVSREELIGPNFTQVYVPNFVMALFREFSSFFYIYQFTILWMYYYVDYWKVGVADTAVILISALVKVAVRLKSEKRIKTMAEFTDKVQILRDNKWKTSSTANLLPGDVFQVKENKMAPCDAAVLTGALVVDESSLTGEPLPIRKFPLKPDDNLTVYDKMGASKTSTIFAGTKIVQAQGTVTALVVNTGTSTDKGKLIKKILFPTRVSFVFDEQIKIVILILLCCGLLCLGLSIWMVSSGTTAWFYSMSAIAQLVSPLLPAALVVGQSVAAGRLRKKSIFCVDLPRILMAGKVQLFCFDKTGTLTKEGLEYYGAQPIVKKEPLCFDKRQDKVSNLPYLMQMGIASCHAVTSLNDQLIGNPVDIEMFKASQWNLEPTSNYVDTLTSPSGEYVHILKRYDFVHARMSMSVAVLDPTTNEVHIFVKGAYEKIKALANKNSIPSEYGLVTSNQAREGCYVLALAHRKVSLENIKEWTRDEMEQDLSLMGLVVFKNQLKEDTAKSIAELKQGDTRTVMITGDTALTGIYIARQCALAQPSARFLLGDYNDQLKRIVWTDVDQPELFPDVDIHSQTDTFELAVTGKAFDWLVCSNLIRKYLLDIRVFARMTPAGKVECVQLHMERGVTAMTGDGGNDCGALRAAHVGIAMSDAEASIVSPFSTNHRSVASCVELIREGRGALATSLTGYKYLILYGQVMMMLKIFTFYFSVSISENIWIVVDIFITVFLTWAVSQSKAASKLAPQRPTAQLLGPQTLASCIGLVAINWVFLSCAYVLLFKQEWFRCNEFDARAVDMSKWMLLSDNFEGEILGFVCLFQFINSAAVFNFGYKFRQSFYRNYTLVVLWLLYLTIASYWLLADPNQFGCIFRFNCGTPQVLEKLGYLAPSTSITPYNTPLGHNVMPKDFRWKLWGLIIGNAVTALAYERFVVLGFVHNFLARVFPVNRLKKVL